MVEAGLCAVSEGPPPPALILGWQCRGYGVLPEAGGLRDQLAGDLDRMIVALNTYDAVSNWKTMFRGGGNPNEWVRRNRDAWKTVQEWMKESGWL